MIAAALAALLAGCGVDPAPAPPPLTPKAPTAPDGSWRPVPQRGAGADQAQLMALGYLDGYETAPGAAGVTRHDPEAAWGGYNLYVSGHAPEAALMDMDGQILHRWAYDFDAAFPGAEVRKSARSHWRRAHLLPDGDLLAIHDGYGILRLDRDSNLEWALHNGAHHEAALAEDGRIYVLTRTAREHPRLQGTVVDDTLTILTPDGQEIAVYSVLDAVFASGDQSLIDRLGDGGDVLHVNTLELLDGRLAETIPAFAAGNVLTSFRHTHSIAVMDLAAEKIVWSAHGSWREQHDPSVLDSGRLLIFDNTGTPRRSAVLEIDPVTGEEVWAYRGTDAEPFFTGVCGAAERLPNGNTVIVESSAGRAFEVDADGQIVWEFFNPTRAGERDQLIATLFDLQRLPPDLPLGWLSTEPASPE